MTPMRKLRHAYETDARVHAIVDMLRHEIEDLQLTPVEVREIAMLACVMVEERRVPGPIVICTTAEEYERLYGRKASDRMFEDAASTIKEEP